MEHYLIIIRSYPMLHATAWMNLVYIMLVKEARHTQKSDILHDFIYMKYPE